MSNSRDNVIEVTVEPTWATPDVEQKTPSTEVDAATIVKRKKREDILKKFMLSLRWLSFLFSFIAFIVMVSNRHGEGINFEDYKEYSYLLAIAIISSLYTVCQGIRQVVQLLNGKYTFHHPVLAIVDFVGDQILAYLLISAASAAAPWTNRMRGSFHDSTGFDYSIGFNDTTGFNNLTDFNSSKVDKFIDTAAAAISMAFLAFFVLALSAVISGYRLLTRFSI